MKHGGIRIFRRIIFLTFLSTMSACSVMRPSMPPLASIEGKPGHFFAGRIINTNDGTAISFDLLIDLLANNDLIFIGEVHSNADHHLIETQILQALMMRNKPLTVAMEFFDESDQPALDRYMEGAVTEGEFLKDVDWCKKWAFDYHFYRPLMLLAKEKARNLLAVNAPGDIVKKVARSGLKSLNTQERNQLATKIDLDNDGHRAYLNEIYQKHQHDTLKNFEYFYEAQCAWEDTMAENIADHIKKHNDKIVVFTGNGHIINKFGIPERTQKRVPVKMATVILYPLTERTTIKQGTADYVWLTGNYMHKHFMHRHKHKHPHKNTK